MVNLSALTTAEVGTKTTDNLVIQLLIGCIIILIFLICDLYKTRKAKKEKEATEYRVTLLKKVLKLSEDPEIDDNSSRGRELRKEQSELFKKYFQNCKKYP